MDFLGALCPRALQLASEDEQQQSDTEHPTI